MSALFDRSCSKLSGLKENIILSSRPTTLKSFYKHKISTQMICMSLAIDQNPLAKFGLISFACITSCVVCKVLAKLTCMACFLRLSSFNVRLFYSFELPK